MCTAPNIPVIQQIVLALNDLYNRIRAVLTPGMSIVGNEVHENVMAIYFQVSTGLIPVIVLVLILAIVAVIGFIAYEAVEFVKTPGGAAISIGLTILIAAVVAGPVIAGVAAALREPKKEI